VGGPIFLGERVPDGSLFQTWEKEICEKKTVKRSIINIDFFRCYKTQKHLKKTRLRQLFKVVLREFKCAFAFISVFSVGFFGDFGQFFS
jgi:hypothetical protein